MNYVFYASKTEVAEIINLRFKISKITKITQI